MTKGMISATPAAKITIDDFLAEGVALMRDASRLEAMQSDMAKLKVLRAEIRELLGMKATAQGLAKREAEVVDREAAQDRREAGEKAAAARTRELAQAAANRARREADDEAATIRAAASEMTRKATLLRKDAEKLMERATAALSVSAA